jgi:hypothetical protein
MLSADVLWARQAAELSPASSESSLPCKSLSQIPGYISQKDMHARPSRSESAMLREEETDCAGEEVVQWSRLHAFCFKAGIQQQQHTTSVSLDRSPFNNHNRVFLPIECIEQLFDGHINSLNILNAFPPKRTAYPPRPPASDFPAN